MSQLFQIFNEQNEQINIYYTAPSGDADNQKPLVLMMHGLASASSTPHNEAFAAAFQKAGYPTLQIDSRHSNNNNSAGQLIDFTIGGCKDDLITVMNWVKQEHPEWKGTEKFILSGHSMGGYAVLSVATSHSNDIQNVIAFSPVTSGEAAINDAGSEIRAAWKTGAYEERQTGNTGNTGKSNIITDKHWDEWRTHDLSQQAESITLPVTLIQAGTDTITPAFRCRALAQELPNATYLEIPDTDHIFRGSDHKIATSEINKAVAQATSTVFSLV